MLLTIGHACTQRACRSQPSCLRDDRAQHSCFEFHCLGRSGLVSLTWRNSTNLHILPYSNCCWMYTYKWNEWLPLQLVRKDP